MPEPPADAGGSRGCPIMQKACYWYPRSGAARNVLARRASWLPSWLSLPGTWKVPFLGPQRSAWPRRTRQSPEVWPCIKNSRSCRRQHRSAAAGPAVDGPSAAKRALLAAVAQRGRRCPVRPEPVHLLRRSRACGPLRAAKSLCAGAILSNGAEEACACPG